MPTCKEEDEISPTVSKQEQSTVVAEEEYPVKDTPPTIQNHQNPTEEAKDLQLKCSCASSVDLPSHSQDTIIEPQEISPEQNLKRDKSCTSDFDSSILVPVSSNYDGIECTCQHDNSELSMIIVSGESKCCQASFKSTSSSELSQGSRANDLKCFYLQSNVDFADEKTASNKQRSLESLMRFKSENNFEKNKKSDSFASLIKLCKQRSYDSIVKIIMLCKESLQCGRSSAEELKSNRSAQSVGTCMTEQSLIQFRVKSKISVGVLTKISDYRTVETMTETFRVQKRGRQSKSRHSSKRRRFTMLESSREIVLTKALPPFKVEVLNIVQILLFIIFLRIF